MSKRAKKFHEELGNEHIDKHKKFIKQYCDDKNIDVFDIKTINDDQRGRDVEIGTFNEPIFVECKTDSHVKISDYILVELISNLQVEKRYLKHEYYRAGSGDEYMHVCNYIDENSGDEDYKSIAHLDNYDDEHLYCYMYYSKDTDKPVKFYLLKLKALAEYVKDNYKKYDIVVGQSVNDFGYYWYAYNCKLPYEVFKQFLVYEK